MSVSPVELSAQDLGNIKNAYSRFWDSLRDLDPASGGYTDEVMDFNLNLEENLISVQTEDDEALQFSQVPYREGDRSKVIDVCVQFKQKIRGRNVGDSRHYEIIESKTSVAYLNTTQARRGEEVELEQGLRFEFSTEPQRHHPVFHAHYDRRCINSQFLNERYQRPFSSTTITNPTYTRIPTAPIDVTSVIHLIIHDHVPDLVDEEDGWPPCVRQDLHDLPKFPIESFAPDPQNGNYMVSDWWYCHQSPVRNDRYSRQVPSDRYPSQ